LPHFFFAIEIISCSNKKCLVARKKNSLKKTIALIEWGKDGMRNHFCGRKATDLIGVLIDMCLS